MQILKKIESLKEERKLLHQNARATRQKTQDLEEMFKLKEKDSQNQNESKRIPKKKMVPSFTFGSKDLERFNTRKLQENETAEEERFPRKFTSPIQRNFALDLQSISTENENVRSSRTEIKENQIIGFCGNAEVFEKLRVRTKLNDYQSFDLNDSKGLNESREEPKSEIFKHYCPELPSASDRYRVLKEEPGIDGYLQLKFMNVSGKCKDYPLVASLIHSTFESFEKEPEKLDEKHIKAALGAIVTKDTRPFDVNFHTTNRLNDLARYYLAPFFFAEHQQSEGIEISLQYEASGLIPDFLVDFLGTKARVSVYAQRHRLLGVTIRNSKNEEGSKAGLRFNMLLEEMTFEKYVFQDNLNLKMKGKSEAEYLVEIMEGISQQTSDDEALKRLIWDFSHGKNSFEVDFLDKFRIASKEMGEKLASHIGKAIESLESFASECFKEKKLFKKSVSKKYEKKGLFRLWYKEKGDFRNGTMCFVKESKESGGVRVHLKNTRESYGPNNSKIMAEGNKTFSFEELLGHFGVEYQSLLKSEKRIILDLLANMHKLEIFKDPIDEDGYEVFEPNSIVTKQIKLLKAKRVFSSGKNQPVAINMSLHGVGKTPSFIKVLAYDSFKREEKGYLLTIDEFFWRRRGMSLMKRDPKKKKQTLDVATLNEYFLIPTLLEKVGWDICQMIYSFDDFDTTRTVKPIICHQKPSFINRLENLLSISNVSKLFSGESETGQQ